MPHTRRQFLSGLVGAATASACGSLSVASCARPATRGAPRVVVAGGGYGGATCAKYLRYFGGELEVTLVEPNAWYHTCPFSNAVLTGLVDEGDTQLNYAGLEKLGVRVIHDAVRVIHPEKRALTLAGGGVLPYDRLVVSPGIELRWNHVFAGYDEQAALSMPHAWRGGTQVGLLKQRLAAMEDGGVFAIVVPALPFRCPPGPYERASLVAYYCKTAKPRSKVLILDANEHFSKQDLFEEAWGSLYPGRIEHVPLSAGGLVSSVSPRRMRIRAEAGEFKVAAASVIPFQRAGSLAVRHGLVDDTGWCPVDHQTFESTRVPGIHVLGDSCRAATMPKSATSASSQAKVCSLAIASLLRDREPGAMIYHNTCYSLAAPDYGFSVTGMYRYRDGRIRVVQRAGGLSPLGASLEYRAKEAIYARDWFTAINADSFGA